MDSTTGKKVYIMIFGIADIVAGGPIYDANKIRFLEENGWDVVVFPVDSGKVYIADLEKYNGEAYGFVHYLPFVFTNRQRERYLEQMQRKIPAAEQIVVETGTDYTALWGELLAEKLGAKHVIFFLDEKNDNVNQYSAPFYRFKYARHELVSISEDCLKQIFSPYFEIDAPEQHVFYAWCSNSVRDIPSDIAERLPKTDYLIGSIGRLEKGYVCNIIDGVCQFADTVQDKTVGLVLFGGTAEPDVIPQIEEKVNAHGNVQLYITGYIWPIPASVFGLFDLFISGAGAARVSADMNVATVDMDVVSYEPLGFLSDPDQGTWVKCAHGDSVCDYIRQAVIEQQIPTITNSCTPEELWAVISRDFKKHITLIDRSESTKEYYPVQKIWDHSKVRAVEKLLFALFSYEKVVALQNFYGKVIKRFRHAE